MIPNKSDKRWQDLVTGRITHQFKSVPAGMCVFRNVRALSQQGGEENIQKSVEEVYAFFAKYESILTDDIKAIFG